MNIENTIIENFLKNNLLRQITISNKNKTIKKGKFLLFKQNGYTIDFHIIIISKNKNKNIICNLPIPFNIKKINDNLFAFDYSISTLSGNNKIIFHNLKQLIPVSKSKFYDTIINIQIN